VSNLLTHNGTLLHRLRRIGRRGATAVVILFTAVWINMALQPCLMAAEPLMDLTSTAGLRSLRISRETCWPCWRVL
jgi:hypothetical protein